MRRTFATEERTPSSANTNGAALARYVAPQVNAASRKSWGFWKIAFIFLGLLLPSPSVSSGFQTQDAVVGKQPGAVSEAKWWKGNLHTHSLWSDGNDFPEMISDWYRQKGYHFLAISDHNVLQSGQKWMDVEKVQERSHGQAIDKYLARFGKSWVETRGET